MPGMLPASGPVDHAGLSLDAVARGIERVGRSGERRGERAERPRDEAAGPGRIGDVLAPGTFGRLAEFVLTHELLLALGLGSDHLVLTSLP